MFLFKKYSLFFFFFLYIFFFFFFCIQLSPLYEFNSWTDVNVYFTIGKGLMNGLVVYKDLFDHKGPLIFLIYGCGYLISNTNFLGVFLIEVCFFSIAIYYIYLIIKMFSSDIVALSVSVVFPIFYLFYSYQGGSAEDFILVAEIVSLYYFISYYNLKSVKHPPKYIFIHGCMLACTFFIKLNLIIFWFFPLLFIFISLISNRMYSNLKLNLVSFIAGFFSILLPVFFYFLVNDALGSFWESYIDFNILYSTQSSDNLFMLILSHIGDLKLKDFIIFFISLLGFVGFSSCKLLENKYGIFVLFLSFIFQQIVIFSAPHLFFYYLLPSLVFVVLGLAFVAVILEKISFLKSCIYLPIVSFVVFLLIGSIRTNLYGYSIESLTTRRFPESQITLFGKEIMTKENPSLLCVGFDKTLTVFTICDIVPNVRYFFLPNITIESHSYVIDTQIAYILNKEVDFLILDERFRYYDYYIEAVNKAYKIKSTCVGDLGYYIHLYEKK